MPLTSRLRPRLRAGLAVAALAALATAVLGGPAAAPASAARTSVGGQTLDLPGVHVLARPGAKVTALPKVDTASFVIADADTGEILAAKNAHTRLRPASTLKTLTAVTLLPRLDPNATYVPVYADVVADGSKVGIVNGSTYTIDELWYGLFLASGNDTAHALARANGGIQKTVDEMNVEARTLQADDTVAKTPSGLDADGQHSSAYDLALISRAGLKMPAFAKYCGTLRVKFPREGKKLKRKTFMTYNHNPLLLGGYRGAIGVKTGYTTLAGRTFVGAAKRGDRTLIVTLMDYNGNTYHSAADMLTWGFKNANAVQPVGQLVDPLPPGAVKNAAAATGGARTTTAGAGGSSSGHLPLWPFALLAVVVLVVAVGAVTGGLASREKDPLAAANKGLGKSGRSGVPRGRGGPGAY